jgi:hypothetical protein
LVFEREGCKPVLDPTPERLRRELRRLRSNGPSSFACLQAENGDYLQVAGSPGGMLLEKREAAAGRQYRGSQDVWKVPFPDGTILSFAGSRIALRSNEWFTVDQVVEVMTSFARSAPMPSFLQWRGLDF